MSDLHPFTTMSPAAVPGFNAKLWRRFAHIAAPYWRTSEERWRATGMLGLLIVLLLGRPASTCCSTTKPASSPRPWLRGTPNAFGPPSGATRPSSRRPCPSTACTTTCATSWVCAGAAGCTQHFLTRYFSGRAYYRLHADAGIDNPDQRIAEDINSFTQQSLYFSMIVLSW